MCGRYHIKYETYGEMGRILGEAEVPEDITGDINPSDVAPVIHRKNGKLSLDKMRWGYPSAQGKGLIINARVETIEEKPMFRADIQFRRCVIPAALFYEWDRYKQKASFELPGQQSCYFAGIYRNCEDMEHFTIITTEANDSMRPVHDRMPLMIAEGDIITWIDDGFMNLKNLKMPALNVHIENEQLSFV